MFWLARDYFNGTTWMFSEAPTMGYEGCWVSGGDGTSLIGEVPSNMDLAPGELVGVDLSSPHEPIVRHGVFEPNLQHLEGYR